MIETQLVLDNKTVAKLINNLRAKEREVAAAGKQGIQTMTEMAFEVAQMDVPVQSGALKDSGQLSIVLDNGIYKGVISYGTSHTNAKGVATETYAVSRHELPSNPKNPRSHKWLEKAVFFIGESVFVDELGRLIEDAMERKI